MNSPAPNNMKKPFEIRTMDALDDWTEWDDDTPADWWLNHPLHHPAGRIRGRPSWTVSATKLGVSGA